MIRPEEIELNFINRTIEDKSTTFCSEVGDCLEYPAWSGDDTDFSANYNVSEFQNAVAATWKRSNLHVRVGAGSLMNTTMNSSAANPLLTTANLCMNGRLVPILYLIGAQKCATSSFAEEFARGHNVVLPEMGSWTQSQRGLFAKELHFFDQPQRYNKGKDFWLAHWPACPRAHMVAAEFTPSYLSTWEAPQRIQQVYGPLVGHVTFLVILREPLARMQSSFYHGLSGGWVSKSYATFEQYVQACIKFYKAKQFRLFHSAADGPVDRTLMGRTGIPFTLSLYHDQLAHWFWFYKSYQFVVAPMKVYTKPDAVPGWTSERDLIGKVAGRAAIQASMPPRQPRPPHRNVHSHPKVEKDLHPETYRQINQLFDKVTGAMRLSALLAPKMGEGLLLYGYQGYLANSHLPHQYRIAAYIKDNW